MLLHTILAHLLPGKWHALTISDFTLMQFIGREIFPGGELPAKEDVIEITSEEVYDRYLRYLTGCADFFRRGIINVGQFTPIKLSSIPEK